MGKRDKDGVSLRETLQTVERMTGRMPAEGINPATIPEIAQHVWAWFLMLNACRQSGMGPSPISHSEMLAFFTLEGIMPEGWELQAIRALDNVALESAAKDE